MVLHYLMDVIERGTDKPLIQNMEFDFISVINPVMVEIQAKEAAAEWLIREAHYTPRLREKLYRNNEVISFRLEMVRI